MGTHLEAEWRGPGAEALGRTYALTRREHRRLADILDQAQAERRPIAPLTAHFPELNESDAAQIRDLVVVRRLRSGGSVIAAKISTPPQGRPEDAAGGPVVGWITASMYLPGPDVDVAPLISPRWHAAFALRLAAPLRTVDSLADLLGLVDQVLPCLEVVDSRHEPAGRSAVDDIADNAAAAFIVTVPGRGRSSIDVDQFSVCCRAGELQEWEHSSRDTVERALASTVPLANRVVSEGRDLGIGGLLISAPASPTRPLPPDHLVHARFGPLGSLHLRSC